MSYQPEPEHDLNRSKLGRQYVRVTKWAKLYPLAFAFRFWLFIAAFSAILLSMVGLSAFNKPSGKLILLLALMGWIVPFTMWIRKNRRLDK